MAFLEDKIKYNQRGIKAIYNFDGSYSGGIDDWVWIDVGEAKDPNKFKIASHNICMEMIKQDAETNIKIVDTGQIVIRGYHDSSYDGYYNMTLVEYW